MLVTTAIIFITDIVYHMRLFCSDFFALASVL